MKLSIFQGPAANSKAYKDMQARIYNIFGVYKQNSN